MLLSSLAALGFLGSILMMFRFSKYCRLLNKRWELDRETADRYQAGAQRSLAAMGVLLGGCVAAIILKALIS